MLSRWPIFYKLLLGVVLMMLIVATLSFSGFRGVYAYRQLARGISARATELPLAGELTRNVDSLRFTFSQLHQVRDFRHDSDVESIVREEFRTDLFTVNNALEKYKEQLNRDAGVNGLIGDNRDEWETVRKIQQTLARIDEMDRNEYWVLRDVQVGMMGGELDELHRLAGELPSYLQKRMHALQGEVRLEYRTWIVLTWVTTILTLGLMVVLVVFFKVSIFNPLRLLIAGSRRVAGGEFSHRIRLDTHDEVAELAEAMNDMTARFQEIRDDLDQQVKERTREVIRKEQLASVGFLAAGVAHEINNPLASIAWSAESLESRVADLFPETGDEDQDDQSNADLLVLRTYLRRIQDEAFRCKGITERLLDFSRLQDVERDPTDIAELIQGVIEMVRDLGKYREKTIEFKTEGRVVAPVNAQEIKQVVLNLITNALDALERDGVVKLTLRTTDQWCELLVEDDGCGMSDETLQHVFEPFFTRRRDGSGTGLGLSITYRIIVDHGGQIVASSSGVGKGSQFRVTLPLVLSKEQENEKQNQAA